MATATTSKTRAKPKQAKRSSGAGVTFDEVCELALALPGVETGTCYGTPGLRVNGKFLLRLREDAETVALKFPMDDREALLQAEPRVFYITEHYRGYPSILFRLSTINREQLADVLETAWRFVAPKRLVGGFDAGEG